MILNSRETCIAYRCPYCGSGIKSMVGVFSLSGTMKKLKCSCEASELVIHQTNDGKIRITVPCLLCGNEHTFVISRELFYEKELFVYTCPYSAMELVFIGKEDAVSAALTKSEEDLMEMLKEMGLDDLDRLHGDMDQLDEDDKPCDPAIYDTVMFVIRDLMESDGISCCCDDGDYDVAVSDDHVKVFCRSCGASKDIPTDSELAAQAFLEVTHLQLLKL
ncbi:MAG: hypothetical protein E7632_07005 [Ruminococcaceae bacterium]|nr:hypothetical protein [Oscillospiraceae bacterium]